MTYVICLHPTRKKTNNFYFGSVALSCFFETFPVGGWRGVEGWLDIAILMKTKSSAFDFDFDWRLWVCQYLVTQNIKKLCSFPDQRVQFVFISQQEVFADTRNLYIEVDAKNKKETEYGTLS